MRVSELIVALGGATAVAAALGQKRAAVSMWAVREVVPPAHQIPLWRLAAARGLEWQPPGTEDLMVRGAA